MRGSQPRRTGFRPIGEGLIAVGTAGFLLLPGLYTGAELGFVDALFTATSAVCVTGLVVVDTATYFTAAGQVWVALLIQLGGLGG